jgi:GDP-4-dehydro-6-deoxy-D-mannose reductase
MSGTSSSPVPFRRVLLTGGSGFVGSWLTPALRQLLPEATLHVLTRHGEPFSQPGWTAIEANLADPKAMAQVIEGIKPDLILHLAAQSSVALSLNAEEETWRINLIGTFGLASACARFAPDVTFIQVSTAETYGASFNAGPADENTVCRPQNVYARSKFAAELMLADVLPATAQLIVVRPFNHTGPGQDRRFVLPSFAAQIAAIERGEQEPVLNVGNLSAQRDFLDVRDVVAAYTAIVSNSDKLAHRETLNIASGLAVPIELLLDKMKALATKDFEIRIDPLRMRPSETPITVGHAQKLTALTGWRPQFSIDETLATLLSYWRRHHKNGHTASP